MTLLAPPSTRRYPRQRLTRFSACVLVALWGGVCGTATGQSLNEPLKVNETFALAAGHFDRGEYRDAGRMFEQLARDYSRYEQGKLAWYWLGESQLALNEYDSATKSYRQFLSLLPHHQLASHARFRNAECAVRQGKHEIAAGLLEGFLRDYPQSPMNEYVLPWLGTIRLNRGEPQLAQAAFERALQLYPRSPQSSASRLGLAKALLIQGQTHDAKRFLQFVAEHGETALAAEASFLLGKIDFQNGDVAAAEKHFLSGARSCEQPKIQAELEYWIARCEIETDRLPAAIERLTALTERPLDDGLEAAAFLDGAAIAGRLDKNEVADDLLAAFLERQPAPKWQTVALRQRLDLAVKMEHFELATQLASQILEMDSTEVDSDAVREIKLASLYRLGRFEAVVAATEELVQPSDTELYYRATSLLQLQRIEDAKVCLNDLHERLAVRADDDPMRTAVDRMLASCLLKLGDGDHGIDLLSNWLDRHGENAGRLDATTELCYALASRGQWEAIERRLAEVADLPNEEATVAGLLIHLANRAVAWSEPGQAETLDDPSRRPAIEHALKWYDRANELGIDETLARQVVLGQAWCLVLADRPDDCVKLFREWSPSENELADARDGVFSIARRLEQDGRLLQAARLYDVMSRWETDPGEQNRARLRSAWCLLQTESAVNLEKAHLMLEELFRNQDGADVETRSEAIYLRYWSAVQRGETSVAKDLRHNILDSYPRHRAWVELAAQSMEEAYAAGDLEQAEQMGRAIIERSDDARLQARVNYIAGRIAVQQRRWDDVVSAMDKSIAWAESGPDAVRARYWIAEARYQMGDYEAALDQFQELSTDAALDETLRGWVFLRLAKCASTVEDWGTVRSAAEQGLGSFADFPRRFEWNYLLGRAYAQIGMFDSSRAQFDEVIRDVAISGSELAAESQWWIGETWFRQKEYEQAIAAYYRVDSLYLVPKWRAAALLQAGKCQEQLGNWSHAAALYRQLVQRYPDSDFRSDAEGRLAMALRQSSTKDAMNRR